VHGAALPPAPPPPPPAHPRVVCVQSRVQGPSTSFDLCSQERGLRYRGECGRPGADARCWTAALQPHALAADFDGQLSESSTQRRERQYYIT